MTVAQGGYVFFAVMVFARAGRAAQRGPLVVNHPGRPLVRSFFLDLRDRGHGGPAEGEEIRLPAYEKNQRDRGHTASQRHDRRRPARLRARRVAIEPARFGFGREIPDGDGRAQRIRFALGTPQNRLSCQFPAVRRIPIVSCDAMVVAVAALAKLDHVAARQDALGREQPDMPFGRLGAPPKLDPAPDADRRQELPR